MESLERGRRKGANARRAALRHDNNAQPSGRTSKCLTFYCDPGPTHRTLMAEASSSKSGPSTSKPASLPPKPGTKPATDDIDKLLAQEESAFQRDFEVSLLRGFVLD